MRGMLLTFGSLLLTLAVVGNAYYQKKQFYPSVVYITKSNPSMAVIYLQAFVMVLMMGKITRKLFFGQLRAAEMEHLIERSWYAVTETCLAFTVFRDDFSPKFVALFTVLLFLKCFHWLAEDRVDYMERSPNISLLFHIRVVGLLTLLGFLDYLFVSHAYYITLTKGPSVQLVFGFEYAILLTVVVNIMIKYVLHTVDLQSENPWENKAVYVLYTELIMGFIKVVLYLTFMTIMIKIHTFPLFAIRPMYLSMRALKKAFNDVIMSRRAIRNMNTLYPDATAEDLASVDNVCIICREEMLGNGSSKKLPCNHIFHTSCLRSWFQRQQTCPTCRMDVLRIPANSSAGQQRTPGAAPGQQQEAQPQPQPQIPNWPGFPLGGGGGPGPFWVPLPQQQPQQQASTGTSAQSSSAAPSLGSTTTTSTTAGGMYANQTNQPFSMPPFAFPPFFLPPPPPPLPQADFSGLTNEELEALEGEERENVEARIRCLRNIQTLLDAAVLQMQQYSGVVCSLRSTRSTVTNTTATDQSGPSVSTPSTSKAPTQVSAEAAKPSTSKQFQAPSSTKPESGDINQEATKTVKNGTVVDDFQDLDDHQKITNSKEPNCHEEIRRRRLEKFSKPLGHSGPRETSNQSEEDENCETD
ncbi:septin interacting protein 3 isoform X1 [Tachypleus tridentatus]|uniref:septin interacting protein 3 isoform X1 n=1 Tax=Tachypleus tridentatus TaxID=6853 RepID=UPI003FD4C12C